MPPSAHDRLPPGSHRHCLHCVESGPEPKKKPQIATQTKLRVVCAIASNLTNDRCNVCGLCQYLSCRSSLLPSSVRVVVCPLALAQKADNTEIKREERERGGRD